MGALHSKGRAVRPVSERRSLAFLSFEPVAHPGEPAGALAPITSPWAQLHASTTSEPRDGERGPPCSLPILGLQRLNALLRHLPHTLVLVVSDNPLKKSHV